MQYTRLMGVDYGDKRIGIALTDALQIIASPYEVYQNKGEDDAVNHICELIKSQNVSAVAFGLPLNMDGTEGERAAKHREVGARIQNQSGVQVHFVDERLTSAEAEELLIESGVRREKRKSVIDKIAAQIILQTYMNNRK